MDKNSNIIIGILALIIVILLIGNNNDELNLIALCNFCNTSANYNRESWINFFNNKMAQNLEIVQEVQNATRSK